MIKELSISRFKSIRELRLECRKVNVFIGAPDTGKTNILEALHLLSRLGWNLPIDGSLRLSQQLGFEPLFYRQFLDTPIRIMLDVQPPIGEPRAAQLGIVASIAGQSPGLQISIHPGGITRELKFEQPVSLPQFNWIRFYSYNSSEVWQYKSDVAGGRSVVNPPYGYNLLYIARHNSLVYDFLKEMLAELDWKLRFDQNLKTFRLSEVRTDEIFDYNLDLLSDSLKRMFFYAAILLTSQEATIVLDEPDVYAFPPYPKNLGEMIGADSSNQFFLTTHNPYFLSSIIAKTPASDLAVFVCSRGPNGTVARLMTPANIELMIEQGAAVFFNLEQFLSR